MPISLHTAFVPRARQTLVALRGLVDKGEAHVRQHGLTDAELIDAKLADDMWALPWHVRACWMHTGYTFDQLKDGEFTPDFTDLPADWEAMRAMIDAAIARVDTVTEDEAEDLSDKTIAFVLGGQRLMELKGQDFLLSFNQPNYYFHATTFYDILRMKGVALTKRDFMGPIPVIGA